jgi:hypothetical protein
VLIQFGTMSDSGVPMCSLPSETISAADFVIEDDAAFTVVLGCVAANKLNGIPTAGFYTSSGFVPGYACVVSVKWDSGFMWMSVASTDGLFEVVYRKPTADSLASSQQSGKALFTSSDVYSLTRGGSSSTDLTGIGEVSYCAFPDSGVGTFQSKTIDAEFGTPSIRSVNSVLAPAESGCPDKLTNTSIENILAGAISVTLSGSGSPSADGDTNWGCYSNSSTVGSGRGCAVWMAGAVFDWNVFGPSYAAFTSVESLRIIARGSVDGWEVVDGNYDCSARVPAITRPSCSESAVSFSLHFGLILKADWFDAFSEDGESVDTKRLARWGGPIVGRAGWNATWGNANVVVSVSP